MSVREWLKAAGLDKKSEKEKIEAAKAMIEYVEKLRRELEERKRFEECLEKCMDTVGNYEKCKLICC